MPMDTDKRPAYKALRRSILVHHYDVVARVVLGILFVGTVILLISCPRPPETRADYEEWMIAFAAAMSVVILFAAASDLMLARVLLQELDSIRDQLHALSGEQASQLGGVEDRRRPADEDSA